MWGPCIQSLIGCLYISTVTHASLIPDFYHNYEHVVGLVLELFAVVANRQICYLSPVGRRRLPPSSTLGSTKHRVVAVQHEAAVHLHKPVLCCDLM